MRTILDEIIEAKHQSLAIARQARPLDAVVAAARLADPARDFYAAVASPSAAGINVIAEAKRASPSAGLLRAEYDPAGLARLYAEAGAVGLSVLTDEAYFQGRLEHLQQARAAVALPVLRKDFVIDEYQIHEARAAGADAVLLITEVLGVDTVRRFAEFIDALGMTALIEVHEPHLLDDLVGRIDFSPPRRRLLGINNRDLKVQQTRVSHTADLARRLRGRVADAALPVLVSESGIRTRADVNQVMAAGASAILVGETLLKSGDPAGKLRELLGAG